LKRWQTVIVAALLVCALGIVGHRAVSSAHAGPRAAPARVALDSLPLLGTSRPAASNNYSAARVVAHAGLALGNGKSIDHGILFGLNPGHGAASQADITFRLGRKYDLLSGTVYSQSGSSPSAPTIEVLDVSNRAVPPRALYTGQAGASAYAAFTVKVRGITALRISASASFDCVCDSGSTAVVVAVLTAPRAQPR
jgi:hypothetical protein